MRDGLVPNATRANEDLTFTLENEQFTGSNPRFFEFDVMVECNTLGTFLNNAPIHLSYNTNAFGSNIVANNKITVTKGTAFADPTYEDPNLLSNDWSSDTVVVILSFDYTVPMNRTEVPTSATKMLHIKIEIANCYEQTKMFFVNQSIAEFVTTFTTTATEPWTGTIVNYDDVNYTGDLDLKLCVPVITTFTNPIHGGIGDVLTIEGKHFGNSRGTGEVWLTDANVGGQYMYKKQDPVDYVSWSDKEIKLRMPSRVQATTVNNISVYPGSGVIGVKTDLGDSALSTSSLDVLYSIHNSDFVSLASDKLRLNLIDDNDSGSYTFQCDTSISNYPLRKAIVERAIHDWNCRTDVNWKLGNDTALQFYGADGVNLIFFDTSIHGNPLGETFTSDAGICQTLPSGDWESFALEVDIRFSKLLDQTTYFANGGWWYDTTGASVPANYLDFYGEILHELGHAHGIRHVNDPIDPMFWTPGNGSAVIPASNRRYQPTKWYNLVDAGIDVRAYSEAINYDCTSATHLISAIETDCSLINRIKEVFEQTGLSVYPNPTNSTTFVNITRDGLNEMQLVSISGSIIYNFSYSAESQEQSSDIYSIDLSSLPSGVYFLNIQFNDSIITEKIIKQ